MEDALMWKGRHVLAEEPFSKRWNLVVQWIEHYCILDARLLGGLDIRTANWEQLASLRPTGSWMLQSDDVGRLPMIWTTHHKESIPSPPKKSVAEVQVQKQIHAPILEIGPLVAVATRDTGPEQWMLTSADGVSLGRALIRRLTVSQILRSVKGTAVRVIVEWISSFKKWEIYQLTDMPACQSAAFAFLPALE